MYRSTPVFGNMAQLFTIAMVLGRVWKLCDIASRKQPLGRGGPAGCRGVHGIFRALPRGFSHCCCQLPACRGSLRDSRGFLFPPFARPEIFRELPPVSRGLLRLVLMLVMCSCCRRCCGGTSTACTLWCQWVAPSPPTRTR